MCPWRWCWRTGRCRDLGSRSSDGYPLITLPDLCGSGARDPARVVRDMWWSRSVSDRDGGRVEPVSHRPTGGATKNLGANGDEFSCLMGPRPSKKLSEPLGAPHSDPR